MNPELSFVTIEYYCPDDLGACIESIQEKCADISYEIIVSSNSLYEIQKRERLKKKFHGVKWIFNEKNLGFAAAMNKGILISSGKCVVVINPDARLLAGSLPDAYDYLLSHPEVGIVGPRIVDNNGNVQDSCRKFLTPVELMLRTVERVFLKKEVLWNERFDYDVIQSVDWVIGAFMMIKRNPMEKVGLFDDKYFLYIEDMDWCKRFWDSGFSVVYYPELVIEYKGDRKSTSFLVSGGFVSRYTLYHLKSYARFLKKYGLGVKRSKRSLPMGRSSLPPSQ